MNKKVLCMMVFMCMYVVFDYNTSHDAKSNNIKSYDAPKTHSKYFDMYDAKNNNYKETKHKPIKGEVIEVLKNPLAPIQEKEIVEVKPEVKHPLPESLIGKAYGKKQNNTTDIEDRNKEFIINPNHYLLTKYEWATWEDSAGGRLSRDPNWFILPPEKYIPKEVPFDFKPYENKSALERRNAYFKHLCETEKITYSTSYFPDDYSKGARSAITTWFYPRVYESPIKNVDNIKEKQDMFYIASQNPYIHPEPGYHRWREGLTIDYYFRKTKGEFNNRGRKYEKLPATTFREYMLDNGEVYRNTFDAEKGEYLPLKKIEFKDIQADYYMIYREIERPGMKKLGIYGQETIFYDRKNKKVINYRKHFQTPIYLDSMRQSNHKLPISWKYGGKMCFAEKITKINDFN